MTWRGAKCWVSATIAVVIHAVSMHGATAGEASKIHVAPLFTHIADIPLGARTSRFDYGSLDAAAGRLYIAKMGSGKLLAFDTRAGKLVAELDGFPTVTGVLSVPPLHKVYASVPGAGLSVTISMALGMVGLSQGSGAVAILDAEDLHEIARLPGGVFPDGIAYDPKHQRVFVSDEQGGAVLVIDAVTDKLIARIDVGGEVGNVQYDLATDKVYAAIQSRDDLAVIDPAAVTLMLRYSLAGCAHPHGLAIAPNAAFGYVACDGNDRLLTVELATGKVLNALPLGRDPDVMAIDAGTHRLYVAGESGVLSSFDIADPAKPDALGDVFVGPNAHAFAIDPASHRLFFPLGNVGGQSVLRVLAP